MLRERTACALGDDLAQQLKPSTDLLWIKEGLRETSDALTILREEGSLPLGGIHDIRETVAKAAMGSTIQPSELLDVAETLASGRRLRAFVLKRAERCRKLAEFAANIGQFQKIEDAVKDCIGDGGEIRDTASPELARIRSRTKTTHSRLVDKLHTIISSSEFRTMIQEPVVTQRGDRYCVPVKAEFRAQFHGIVHDSSASGATLFIEPVAAIEMGNELRELVVKEKLEVDRILQRLSGMICSSAPEIKLTLGALGRLDFASAKALLSGDMDASEPDLNCDGRIEMRKARHPLLTGEVVPINIELGKRFNAILITGPNTGGKTVTLKTIGLLTLMAQSGLHIPASQGSEVAVCERVYADIGDEQSIQQSLSTFSSHLRNIINIVESLPARPRSALVLIDEIGAGTDPGEGAALAKAILDYLLAHGALIVATTHYGELKEYAYLRDGVENASVEFDVRSLMPTYRLMIGVPGSSNAFAIASRLGLRQEIIVAAAELVRGGEASEEMIRRIEESHRTAAEREQVAERTSRDVEILKTRYEDRLEELNTLRRGMRRELAEEVDRRVKEKIDELDEIIRDLKQQPATAKKVHESRQAFKKRVNEISEQVEDILPDGFDVPEGPFELKKGDRVRIGAYNVEGDLLNDPGSDDALVMVGSMKVNAPFGDIRPARRIREKAEAAEKVSEAVQLATSKAVSISPELKLIAQRVEQALMNLDKYLDDAYLAGLASVRIIHGKGTGALRRAVWEFLSAHNAVESYHLADANEGGAGATIVKFKNK
jgi:DNA mismatch repair protein MutS2